MKHFRLAGWKSNDGRRQYLEAYDEALELWTAPFESIELTTRFGATRAIASGPPNAPAVLLLPAATGLGALQWYANAAALAVDHRILALDFVGAPGGGTPIRPMIDRHDYAAWLTDVLDTLGLDSARFVGSSQGGWFVLNLCIHQPERVEAAALLAPAASLIPFSRGTAISLRLPPPPAWTARPALRATAGSDVELDERLVRVMALGLKHFRYQQRAVIPDVFGDVSLSQVTAPMLVMVGDKEIIYDPRDALDRAQRAMPGAEAVLVPQGRHLLNVQFPKLIEGHLLNFFTAASVPVS